MNVSPLDKELKAASSCSTQNVSLCHVSKIICVVHLSCNYKSCGFFFIKTFIYLDLIKEKDFCKRSEKLLLTDVCQF